jgi:hypothetical protein
VTKAPTQANITDVTDVTFTNNVYSIPSPGLCGGVGLVLISQSPAQRATLYIDVRDGLGDLKPIADVTDVRRPV